MSGPCKPDPGIKNGVGRSLTAAFAPNSPIDPELTKLIRAADGVYVPDEVADNRVGQMLERLKRLPWGLPPIAINGNGGEH